jgi:hypothetical protein
MSALNPDQVVTLTEILLILAGLGIIWVIYYGSERAELPGEATIPDPAEADDTVPSTEGRTLV